MGNKHKESSEFNIGDFIVAFGTTITEQGIEKHHRILAEIVGVGDEDLFAISESNNRAFKIAASRCAKLPIVEGDIFAETIIPRIGDLVLSFVDKFSGTEKKMGLLIEVIDMPGRNKIGKLLRGDDTESVPFESLIVIEQRHVHA